jgi:protein O-mannosyl-transferase
MGGLPFQEKLRSRAGMTVVLATVSLASIAIYLPATRYGFVWDDTELITKNSLLAGSRPADIFLRGFWAGAAEQIAGPHLPHYRPLVTLSFWLDLRVSHANPHWFHVANLLLYALASAAVTLVLWELLHSGVWALLGGLFFAAHSSHVESVAFVSGRTDVMLTIFTAISAFALLRSLRKHNRWWWLVVPPAFGLALLSKETAVVFPLLIALAPLLVGAKYDRRYWLPVLASMIVLAGYFLLRTAAVPIPIPFSRQAGIWDRLASIVNTFGLYVRMFFWPFKHQVWYQANSTSQVSPLNMTFALLLAISAPLLILRRRLAPALWGYAWTIAFLLPVVSGLVLGPIAAERLLFLPSAGIVMVLTTVFSRMDESRSPARRIAGVGVAVVIVLLGADSMIRTPVWRNGETLFSAMVREAPTAPSAYSGLADEIAGARPDSALALHEHALRVNPSFAQAHMHAAVLLLDKGDLRGAIQHLRIARELVPNSDMVLNNLALAFNDSGEVDSALATIDRAIEVQQGGTAVLHLNRANVLIAAGRTDEAADELRRALALDSTVLWARTLLAEMLSRRGQYDSAIVLAQREVAYRPTAASYTNLGDLFISTGDSARAWDSYNQALRCDPTYVPALYNLSVMSAARGDLAGARKLAEQAYRLRPDLEAISKLCLQLAPHRGPNP